MIDLIDYGFTPALMTDMGDAIPARVTAVYKEKYELVCEHGACLGKLKTSVYYGAGVEEFPTTGDFTAILYNPIGDSQIVKTLPRVSCFSRREPGPIPRDQAVAANFDYVFIMQSLNQNFNVKRLERYLTLAWQSNAVPVVALTKADLTDDTDPYIREVERVAPGVGVYPVSTVTGSGIDKLSDYLKPRKTLVFLGSSGVGKSSLVNALAGESLMAVNAVREDDARGRHTTTHRQLVMLPSGVMIIDTPGMRELGMWDVSTGIGEAFADVEQYLDQCKFSDCKHQSEPGCVIKAAITSGALSQERWDSYLQLKREARYADDKMGALQEKWKRNKEIAKYQRQINKKGDNTKHR